MSGLSNLPHTVDPLKEDGASLFIVVFVITVTNTLAELVSKTQPFFLYQNLHMSYVLSLNHIINHHPVNIGLYVFKC